MVRRRSAAGEVRAGLHLLMGQRAGLANPVGGPRLVELVVLVDVEIAHVRIFGCLGRGRVQRGALEEGHLHIAVEAMEAEEPMVRRGIGGAVERRIPLHRLADVGDRSEEQQSELQSLMRISYAVYCLKTKNK